MGRGGGGDVRFKRLAQQTEEGPREGSKRGLAPFFASSASRLTSADAFVFAAPPPKKEAMLFCPPLILGAWGTMRDTRRGDAGNITTTEEFFERVAAHVGLCNIIRVRSHAKLVFKY